MTKKQQLLGDLRDIEIDTIKKEKNFDFRTALIKIFKGLYRLFESKQDVSKKDIVSAAERESKRSGLEGRYNWNEIFGLKEVDQSIEQQGKQLTSSNGNSYPDNFYVGKAIANGSCFFDSFRQGLEQQKGIKVTIEQLRKDCKEFVSNNAQEWFIRAIANSYDNDGRRYETTNSYAANILNNNRWGDPDIEGRILCEKYGVKLHVVENNPLKTIDNQQDPFLHQLIDHRGSKSAGEHNKVDYNDSSVLHIINKGGAHFEPLLDKNKSLAKQPQKQTQEQKDFLFARELQEKEDHNLAREFQVDEILEYFNMPKDSPLRKEVHNTLDELLTKNPNKEIGDIVKQCTDNIKQRISNNGLLAKQQEEEGKFQQEQKNCQFAEKLQAQEINSFMLNSFQEQSDRLLAERLQKEEFAKHRQGQKSFSPGCGMQEVRLTSPNQTQQLVK